MAKAVPVVVVAPIAIIGKFGGDATKAHSLSGWAKKYALASGVSKGKTLEFTYRGKQYVYHQGWDDAATKFQIKLEQGLFRKFRFHGR